MKVFPDKRTARRFVELYEKLDEPTQRIMGQKVRELADTKMQGDGDEFYVTTKDLDSIFASLC